MQYTDLLKTCLSLFGFLLISTLAIVQAKAQCNLNDFLALKALYQSTEGDSWNNRAFWDMVSQNETPMPDCDLSFLHGIALDMEGRVNSVGLFNNNLKGELPEAIGNLTQLTSLSLTDNLLSGSLPDEIGQLVNLTDLSLSNNQFTGSLPASLFNLKKLEILFLNNNQFSGNISSEITELHNLLWIFLEQNQFSGKLPVGFSNLTNLTYLSLYQNSLEGDIPNDLDLFDNLKWVLLQQNNLSGCFPANLCQLDLDSLNFMKNPKLPMQGDFESIDSLCSNSSVQIGLTCDDGKDDTIDDIIQENCTCNGKLMIAINDEDEAEFIQLFPNPVADFIYLSPKINALNTIQIINLEGKIILSQDSQRLPFIEVQHLAKGKYFLQIMDEKQKMHVFPFLKL